MGDWRVRSAPSRFLADFAAGSRFRQAVYREPIAQSAVYTRNTGNDAQGLLRKACRDDDRHVASCD